MGVFDSNVIVKTIDQNENVTSILQADGCQVVAPYYYAIADNKFSDHSSFNKIGWTPTMTTADSDVWSNAGAYVFPTSAMGMEVLSSNNTDDVATSIRSNGTSTGGTTTSLIDATADFTASTAVAVGDCVVLDKSGTNPEYGFVTAIPSATQITVAGGFSNGGSGSGRNYYIVDYSSTTGAHVLAITYLDGSYVEKKELCILNGTTVVATVNLDMFRINSFKVVASGSNGKPTGNLSIRHLSDTPIYSYITAGFTRARNSVYTVPYGKKLWIHSWTAGWCTTAANNNYCRLFLRANVSPNTLFLSNQPISIFYPHGEIIAFNEYYEKKFDVPYGFPAKTDIKISGIATAAGVAMTTLKGWIEE